MHTTVNDGAALFGYFSHGFALESVISTKITESYPFLAFSIPNQNLGWARLVGCVSILHRRAEAAEQKG